MRTVTVAIPVRNGAGVLDSTLAAVCTQKLDSSASLQLLVCDSGSTDGSVALARAYGAEVFEIAPDRFSHGGTRNLLMERAGGAHVAFLTQDSVPADDRWLERLLGAFGLADDVALTFGPYRPRPEASPMVSRELADWFRSFSPDGLPVVHRLVPATDAAPRPVLLGPAGYFTDANGCVSRAAWEAVPFRAVSYAEDHVLAHDMLRAGYAKAYVPEAGVVHSHDYPARDWLRRSFDEHRALREIYELVPPLDPRRVALGVWGNVGADWRWAGEPRGPAAASLFARSATHHAARALGGALGARSARLPARLARRLSLEGRGR